MPELTPEMIQLIRQLYSLLPEEPIVSKSSEITQPKNRIYQKMTPEFKRLARLLFSEDSVCESCGEKTAKSAECPRTECRKDFEKPDDLTSRDREPTSSRPQAAKKTKSTTRRQLWNQKH